MNLSTALHFALGFWSETLMRANRKAITAIVLALMFASNTAIAGSVRYELPELLGEHRYDGTSYEGNSAHIDTPFNFYSVRQARLVVDYTVTAGVARGDGVVREATSFSLVPFVEPHPSFSNEFILSINATIGTLHFDRTYPYPFAPETTPLPNPSGYPPQSFDVGLLANISFSTLIPPAIHPSGDILDANTGIIVDVPIVVNVTNAYIVLEGPGVVPEPTGLLIVLGGASVFAASVRLGSRRRDDLRGIGVDAP